MGNVILVNDNKTGKLLKKVVRKQIGEILRTVKIKSCQREISQNTNKRYVYHILFGCSIICFPLIHFAGTASVTLSEKIYIHLNLGNLQIIQNYPQAISFVQINLITVTHNEKLSRTSQSTSNTNT